MFKNAFRFLFSLIILFNIVKYNAVISYMYHVSNTKNQRNHRFTSSLFAMGKTKLEKLMQSVDYIRTPSIPEFKLVDDPLLPFVETIVSAADKRKASYINAIRVSHLTEVTTFLVLIEGKSAPQNQALANSIQEDVMAVHQRGGSKEGTAASGWILLDYGSIVVHIMTPAVRNFYKLEKKWKDAEVVEISHLISGSSSSDSEESEMEENYLREVEDDVMDGEEEEDAKGEDKPIEEQDPFWS